MALDFNTCVEFILSSEGGYVNDPSDPGGETKFGISKRAYPNVDIKNLTVDGAKAIYKKDYWDAINGDCLDPDMACAAFDTAVNMGVGRARGWLAIPNIDLDSFLKERTDYYSGIVASKPTQAKYLRGWLNRIASLRLFIQQHQ